MTSQLPQLPAIAELIALPQWVCWRWVTRDGKRTKPPLNPMTGNPAEVDNPETWSTFEIAREAANKYGWDGTGVVIASSDRNTGVDFDDCIDPSTRVIDPWTLEAIRKLDSYAEVSPSNNGVKVWIHAKLPAGARCRTKFRGRDVEMYSTGRFFTVTGNHLEGTPTTINDRQVELEALYKTLFGNSKTMERHTVAAGNGKPISIDDAELISIAISAKNGAKFTRLWNGDTADYGGDESSADMALCCELAFWTAKDPARMDSLFRQSGLYREKWERQDYRERTINRAIDQTVDTYNPRKEQQGLPRKTEEELRAPAGTPGNRQDSQTHPEIPRPDNRAAAKSPGPSQATRLINLTTDVQLFSTPERKGYAELKTNAHREVWPIHSRAFKIWLARKFYNSERTAANAQALQDALAVIEARATFDSNETHEVFVRLAGDGTAVYLDLVDDAWRVVKVDATGWKVISDCPVKFTRKPGMLPLPVPVNCGSLSDLKKVVNIGTEEQWILFVAWLVAALRPNGPYPILTVHGEQGSAKTFLGKAARFLIDPSKAPMRAVPRDERDLMIAAINAHIITIDNLSHVHPWLADALCRLSTGAGLSTRGLWTNDEEVILEACRPIILNGITEFTGQGDLLQREVALDLPVIDDKNRKEERVLWPELERFRPGILGALLDGLSAAIRNHPMVKLDSKPRMADFAVWAMAAEEQFGFRSGSFINAYSANIKNTNTTALESSLVAPVLLSFMKREENWTGTSSELLGCLKTEALKTENSTDTHNQKTRPITERDEWPKSPRALSGDLARLAPNLRIAGLSVKRLPRQGTMRRWELTLCGDQCKRPSQPSSPSQGPLPDTRQLYSQDVTNSDQNDGRRDGPGANDGDRHDDMDDRRLRCDGRTQGVTVDDGGTTSQAASNGCAQPTDSTDDMSSASESNDGRDGRDGLTPTPYSRHKTGNLRQQPTEVEWEA